MIFTAFIFKKWIVISVLASEILLIGIYFYKYSFVSDSFVHSLVPAILVYYYIYGFVMDAKRRKNELEESNRKLEETYLMIEAQNRILNVSEKKLKENIKKYELLANISRELVIIVDSNKIIKYVSPSVNKALKRTTEELIDKRFETIVENSHHDLVYSIFHEISGHDKNYQIQFKLIKKDGSYIWVDALIQVITENNYLEYHLVLRDITSIIKREESLRLFSDIISQTEDAIIITEMNGDIFFANYKTSHLYGLAIDELLHLSIIDIESDLNDQTKWQDHIKLLFEKKLVSCEKSFLKSDGSKINVEERWQYTEVEHKAYVIKFMNLIEERKQNEQKIRKTLERQHILSQISFLINTTEDFEYKINEALRIFGNYLDISRITVFQNMLNGKAVNCMFEWHAANTLSSKKDLQAIPYSLIPSIAEGIVREKYIYFDKITNIPKDIISLFLPYETYTLLITPLKTNSKSEGFICYIDNIKTHKWQENDIKFINIFTEIITNAFKQKEALESLLSSEKRFKELAELLPEMVCEAAINGKITFANKHTQIQFGFTENDLPKGIIFFNFFAPHDKERVLENFEKILRSEHVENEEYTIINREKISIPVLLYMNVIMRDQMPIGLRAVMVDISERKEQEIYYEKLANMAENSPIPMFRINNNGEILYFNKKATEIKNFVENNFEIYFKELLKNIDKNKSYEEISLEIDGLQYKLLINSTDTNGEMVIYAL